MAICGACNGRGRVGVRDCTVCAADPAGTAGNEMFDLGAHLGAVLDVTAHTAGRDAIRVQMGRHATANQPGRVERAIEAAGYQVTRRTARRGGTLRYQVRRR